MRRDFELLPNDTAFLSNYGLPWDTVRDGSQWVLLQDFLVPSGYSVKIVTTAIRLESGYPDAQLDMAYFHPNLTRIDGVAIPATNATQTIDGKPYQRWSRHRTAANPWIPGQDSLGTHILLIEDWLEREFER